MGFANTIKILLPAMLLLAAIQPTWGQQLRNLDVMMIEDGDRTVCLTAVTMFPSHTYFDEQGRSDIYFSYETTFVKKGDYTSSDKTSVRFMPTDKAGIYRVEEMASPGRRISLSNPTVTTTNDERQDEWRYDNREWSIVGYSDDTSLLAVKVYDYYLQNASAPTVYEPDKLDEKAYFIFDGAKIDFNKYISDRLERYYSGFTDNLKGSVKFSFVVHPYGWAIDFEVSTINLKPKNEFIRINGDTDIDFAQQIDILFRGLNYMVVEYGFYTRHSDRYWTPGKIDGKAVASRQYLTFTFK